MPDNLRDFVIGEIGVTREDVFIVRGMLAMHNLSEIVAIDRPDLKFEPFIARFPERIRDHNGDCFAAIRAEGHHRPPPLRILRRRRAVPAPGSARSRRGGDQADALPHVERFPDRRSADRGGRVRQVRHRAGGTEGPLRRGSQHPLGPRPGARRRAGGLRLRRAGRPIPSCRRSCAAKRASSSTTCISAPATITRSPRAIYTDLSYFTADPTVARDVAQIFNYITGYAEPERLENIAFSPITLQADAARAHRRGGGTRQGRPSRQHLGEDELAGRPGDHRCAVPCEPGRRADRTRRARHLLPAPRRAGPVRTHPRQVDRRPLPRAWPHLVLRQRPSPCLRAMRWSISARPT